MKFLEEKIDDFFTFNTNQTSASIKWEAFKAYIRGEIISFNKHKSKSYYTQLNILEKKVKELEQQLYHNVDQEKERELLQLKCQYNELTTSKIASSLMWLNQTYYDQGEKAGKGPGPDGLPTEIYKKFSGKLLPHLLNVFNESYETSLRSAVISLLLKPGKSPSDRTAYHPIPLMSCDTKILCKAIAKRIETIIPHLINNDQNGFVLG